MSVVIANAKTMRNLFHCFRPLFDTITLGIDSDGLFVSQISRDNKVLVSLKVSNSDSILSFPKDTSKGRSINCSMDEIYNVFKSVKKGDSCTIEINTFSLDITLYNAFSQREFILPGKLCDYTKPCDILKNYDSFITVDALALHRCAVDTTSHNKKNLKSLVSVLEDELIFQTQNLQIILKTECKDLPGTLEINMANLKSVSRLFSLSETANIYFKEDEPFTVSYDFLGSSVCSFCLL